MPAAATETPSGPAFSDELLHIYYQRLFPYDQVRKIFVFATPCAYTQSMLTTINQFITTLSDVPMAELWQ
jgi:hypothetical protein